MVRRLGSGASAGLLQRDALGEIGVAPADDLVDEAAIGGEVVEVALPAQQQRILERLLEMAVSAFDRAVLVGDARLLRVGSCRSGPQRLVARGQILPRSAVRLRNAADRLSLRCSRGAPPSAHSAFCSPSASATKLSPPSTTWACSKPEKASRK